MQRFWDLVIHPILSVIDAKNVVEIGSQSGKNTDKLIKYCAGKSGTLFTIDPEPLFDLKTYEQKYGNTIQFYLELSLNALPKINSYDAILIDGDHNWYTVYNELKIIEQTFEGREFPVVFIHDIHWPYGRRDLYYNPDNIPLGYQQPYKKMGISPSYSSLVEQGGLNPHLNNSIYEHTPKNGVLTAIEDFVKQTSFDLLFYQVPGFHGLGIIINRAQQYLIKPYELYEFSNSLVRDVELQRVMSHIKVIELNKEKKQTVEKTIVLKEQVSKLDQKVKKLEKLLEQKDEYLKRLERENQETHKQFSVQKEQINELNVSITFKSKEIDNLTKMLAKKNTEYIRMEKAANTHLNSVRYKLGDALILASKPSKHTLLLPARMFNLLTEGKKNRIERGQDENIKAEKYKSSEIKPENTKQDRNIDDKMHIKSQSFPKAVDIIIPIYNAFEELVDCINSILKFTDYPEYRILLVNDCSPDNRISAYLQELESRYEHIVVMQNEKNLGFIETVNKGMLYSDRDVILLNSDTRVTRDWLRSMVICAYSKKEIATVTPLSNAAGPFSVPYFNQNQDLPNGYSEHDMAELLAKHSRNDYPSVPTGNGFCMFIKRFVLDQIGVFDQIYGRGYCEENDFCMRVKKYGMMNVIDDSTFIYHKRSVSFGDDKNELLKKNRLILDDRYPNYKSEVDAFLKANPLEHLQVDMRLDMINSNKKEGNHRNLLFVLHKGGGGTPLTNLDLTRQLSREYNCFILISDSMHLELSIVDSETGNERKLKSYYFQRPIQITDFRRDDYEQILINIINKHNINLIHVRHLLGHTFDLPYIANQLNIPLVMSFHDFYFICPTIQLLDNNMRYCGGNCTPGNGTCNYQQKRFPEMPELKHKWVYTWKNNVRDMLNNISYFVTTSEYSKKRYTEVYQELENQDFRVIEHGRDLNNLLDVSELPKPNSKIKIVTFGGINESKGMQLIIDLVKLDRARSNRLELHVLGNTVAKIKDFTIYHGPYERDKLGERLKEIKPNFSVIFSIWPETYCHTLTESWAFGLPPFVSDIGTLRERVLRHKAGWLVDYTDVEKVYKMILQVSDSENEYYRVKDEMKNIRFKDTNTMSNEYNVIYKELLNETNHVKSVSKPTL
ncbi:glycosyltransferase [Paenibacillus humicola]|uniref:glycosyltransferase n=1 Tax=Paenibacillus humicola TaxID=3110540 RepID=UPI00237A955C|nr:glycosyltransferase [Paenibacillus humicola]